MLDNLKKYDIVLASNSPRRRELLSRLGIDFRVFTLMGIDETFPKGLSNEEIALHIASTKAEAYKTHITDNTLLITADTIVCLEGRVLGKPHDIEEATAMLHLLSGKEHEVVTAFTLNTVSRVVKKAVSTRVRFAPLTDEEINYYGLCAPPISKTDMPSNTRPRLTCTSPSSQVGRTKPCGNAT